jgi:hypothetical protein
MWATTLLNPAFSLFSRNRRACSASSGLKAQPRGFRVKIWKVVQPSSRALSTARGIDSAIYT